MEDNNTLKILTLGRFEVRRRGEIIYRHEERINKRWRFFQVLLTYKDQPLSAEQLYRYLQLEDSVNPQEALKALAFYLRQSLKGSEDCKEKYIIGSRGRYTFNENSDYWLDGEEFENLLQQAVITDERSLEERILLYRKALALYRGNYLAEIPRAYWAMSKKNHFRELYLRAIIEASELLQMMGEFGESWNLCEAGLRIIPLEEKLHISSLKALIASKRMGLALVQFEEASSLFRDNGLDIPPGLRQVGETLKRKGNLPVFAQKVYRDISRRKQEKGAFESNMEMFSVIYRLEKARNERGGKPSFLLQVQIRDNGFPEQVEKAILGVRRSLKKGLRKGDIFCKSSSRVFLAIIFEIAPEEIPRILERIKKEFYSDSEEDTRLIKTRWRQI